MAYIHTSRWQATDMVACEVLGEACRLWCAMDDDSLCRGCRASEAAACQHASMPARPFLSIAAPGITTHNGFARMSAGIRASHRAG